MRSRSKIAAALVLVGLAPVAALGAKPDADQRAKLEERLEELQAERIKSTKYAVEAYRAAFEAETVTLLELLVALEARLDARLAVAKGVEKKIEAYQEHIGSVHMQEQKIGALREVQARGGEEDKYWSVVAHRQAAQIEVLPLELTMAADAAKKDKLNAELKKLQAERQKSTAKAVETTLAAYDRDPAVFDLVLDALKLRLDAKLGVAQSAAEKLEAHKQYLDALGKLEDKTAKDEAYQKSMLTTCRQAAEAALAELQLAGQLPEEERKKLSAQLAELKPARQEDARRAAADAWEEYRGGTCTLNDWIAAQQMLLEAELALAEDADAKLSAYRSHRLELQSVEGKISGLYNVGERGGEAEKYARITSCSQAAEIALIQAQLAADR